MYGFCFISGTAALLLYTLHKYVQYNLCIVPKMKFNIAISTNRENIQKIFKKVVDNARMMWYHNQAVTKRTDRKKAEKAET